VIYTDGWVDASGSNNRNMSNNIFMSKSSAFLALTASERQLSPKISTEFMDLLHFQLDSAVNAKKMDVFYFITTARRT
jgi:hypothetical protein